MHLVETAVSSSMVSEFDIDSTRVEIIANQLFGVSQRRDQSKLKEQIPAKYMQLLLIYGNHPMDPAQLLQLQQQEQQLQVQQAFQTTQQRTAGIISRLVTTRTNVGITTFTVSILRSQ